MARARTQTTLLLPISIHKLSVAYSPIANAKERSESRWFEHTETDLFEPCSAFYVLAQAKLNTDWLKFCQQNLQELSNLKIADSANHKQSSKNYGY